ncbi:UPF0109 protein [Candidatus Protochlamydia amoebophila]|nr:UPF0109 protein [Candidatus Protochlamydia amoebophila]
MISYCQIKRQLCFIAYDVECYQRFIFAKDRIMKEFVAYIVKNLVDHPDKVKINEIGGTQTLIIELSVEKSDIGKIIGKKGKTINAIRTLLMSVASRNGIRVNLEILEENSRPE